MHPLINIATNAARRAGDLLVRYLERVNSFNIQAKGRGDFVSDIDKAAEREIISVILKAYPNHAILGEESGVHEGEDCQWIIDPLDGTRNYLNGYPHFCVSIGIKEKGHLAHGVIYNPLLQEMFSASRGGGATLNSRRIRVSTNTSFERALMSVGLSLDDKHPREAQLQAIARLTQEAAAIRRSGSAALDLAYVAAGRLDAFWEYGLKPWDVAAGVLLVREAGGLVAAPNGSENYLETGDVLASSAKLFRPILQLLNKTLKDSISLKR